MAHTTTVQCWYFSKGFCRAGDTCRFVHERDPGFSSQPVKHPTVHTPPGYSVDSAAESSFRTPPDSRAQVSCKFDSRPAGCQNSNCPFLHTAKPDHSEQSGVQDLQAPGNKDQDPDEDSTRDLAGATVTFDEFGHVLKVSLPTDFSTAVITGFAPGTTPEALADTIRGLGLRVSTDAIHILAQHHVITPETRAIVKVEDPVFAKELCIRLERQETTLQATALPVDARQTNYRKVYISWHKASRNVWLNFGNGNIAERVARKFNGGHYHCLGHSVTSSAPKRANTPRLRGVSSYNPVAWTIVLSGVPKEGTMRNMESAITAVQDKPRHIEMGQINYKASAAEVSVDVRSLLEQHGRLENFYLDPSLTGKRVKATAWFQDGADARSACVLDGRSLQVLTGGKLTVTLIHSAKVKIPMSVYLASKVRIEQAMKTWSEQHLVCHVYSDPSERFNTLKVEGNNAKLLASARKVLDDIANGVALTEGGITIWKPVLTNNRRVYHKLKSIEQELQVKILRDNSKRQLRFFGPSEKFQDAVRRVLDMLATESSTKYEIDLETHQFHRMIQGDFRQIERALGADIASFDVVSRKIIVNGTVRQYNMALAIVDGNLALKEGSPVDILPVLGRDCPICFCEADTPVNTSCEHTYCFECFEEYCKSAASTSRTHFQIPCQGNGGNCSKIFNLHELKTHLSSQTFEKVLKSSFEEYIQRHAQDFRYCPTPDCGFIYRCALDSTAQSSAYTCPNCFEPICTSCHARHGNYSCAEYKDIASGGREALERLKRELNIKDCPKCTTPMEKTEGCNHMTCGGCKAHICWVCMAVFDGSGPCYDHMNKMHGGIGLGLERFAIP